MHNLLGFDRAALENFFIQRQQPRYRAEQVFSRIHNGQQPPNIFFDLPKPLRAELTATTICPLMPVVADSTAADGVRKWLFDVSPNNYFADSDSAISAAGKVNPVAQTSIETVLIPETKRQTLCISSQAGCALACRFCLTGKQGFSRNLSAAEIISQLRQANQMQPHPMTNVVFMGMGEPLLNLDAVLPALRIMIDVRGYALPPRRITVSTAGIVPAMARLTEEALKISLAISLHAPVDSLRDDLMPINRKYPLAELMNACRRHIQDRPRAFITFEYVMLKGINDDNVCARDLARLLRGLRCKVNLIPFNIFPNTTFECSEKSVIFKFRDTLMKSGIMTTIRKTRGDDILAACGQLAGNIQARTMGLGDAPINILPSTQAANQSTSQPARHSAARKFS